MAWIRGWDRGSLSKTICDLSIIDIIGPLSLSLSLFTEHMYSLSPKVPSHVDLQCGSTDNTKGALSCSLNVST